MKNNIDGQINTLNKLAKGGINKDKFYHEFRDVFNTLESIKKEADKGGTTKEQLNKIIAFLNQQINTIPNGDFNAVNKLSIYKNDFQNLLLNFKKETYDIHNESKKSNKELSVIVDQAVTNGQVTNEIPLISKNTTAKKVLKTKPQINFFNNKKQNFESNLDLNNLTSYTVKSGDNLWNIVKKQYPSLTKTNKDIIHIINYIVNLNTHLEPKKLKHLMRDDKLAWGKKGSDGIAGDNLRIGDILKFPKIKSNETAIPTQNKAPKNNTPESNEVDPKLEIEKKVLIKKAEEIQDEHIRSEIIKEIKRCTSKQCLNKIRDDINKLIAKQESVGTVETRSYFKTVGFTQNGENYIIGKDGEPKLITTQELTPEYKEALKEYKETLLLTENINLLLSALSQNGEDVSKFNTQLKNKINSFNPLELKKSVDEIKTTINSIFNNLDIDNKKEIDLKSTISIYNYIRDELDNYELVRKQIVEKEFNNLTKISQEELDVFIKNPTSNQEKIKKILGEEGFKDFQKEISKKRTEAETYYIDHQKELKEQFPNLNINNIKALIIDSFVGSFAKIAILEAYVEKNLTYERGWIIKDTVYDENKGNDNIDLFADIQGIGTFDWSDKNLNYGSEAFILIATEIAAIAAGMVSMGVGAYAVNAAVYGTRAVKGINYLYKTGRLTNTTLRHSKLAGVGKGTLLGTKTAKFATMSTIEGGTFYAGYAGMQSKIEGKNMYSTEGLYQSVVFMGAFKALNGVFKIMGRGVNPKLPLNEQKLTITQKLSQSNIFKIGVEGTAVAGLGLGFEGVILEPGEWTAETILQAFTMVIAFRGAGMIKNKLIKIRQTKGSKVEAVEQEVGEVFVHKNGKEYIKGADGKYRDTDGRIRNIAEKNLRKKVSYTLSTEAPIDKNAKPLNPNGTLNRTNKSKFDKKTIDKNKGLNETDRINEAEKLLGRKLSKEEQKAIIDAHNIDFNKGNLKNIKDKVLLLKIFSKEERRILLDSGICGKIKTSTGPQESFNIKEKIKNLSDIKIINYLSNLKGWEEFKKFPLPDKKATIKFLKSMAISGTLSVAIHETFTEWDPGISKMQRVKELALVFLSGAALGGTFIFAQKGIYSAWIVSKGATKVIYQGTIKPIAGKIFKHKVPIGLTGFAGYTTYNLIQKP